MIGYTCAWCEKGHLGDDCPDWGGRRPSLAPRRIARLTKLVKALQEQAKRLELKCFWNERFWRTVESLEKHNQDLRQELLERAEAHEDAETRCRAAKDFGQEQRRVAESRHSWLWNIIEEVSLGDTRLRRENAALRRELNSIVDELRQELLERAEAHEEAAKSAPNIIGQT